MLAKIYKRIKAGIINNKDDLFFYLKMNCTYLPLFVLSILTNFACYNALLDTGNSDAIRIIGPLSMLLTIVLSIKMAVLDERHKFKEKTE